MIIRKLEATISSRKSQTIVVVRGLVTLEKRSHPFRHTCAIPPDVTVS